MGCVWSTGDAEYLAYHDDEWGVPVRDDRLLFEMLTLEGAQAGLSWLTILRKRAHYRKVFANFEIDKVARFTPARIEKILLDPGVVRHRGKLESVVSNARVARQVRKTEGSLDALLWSFVGGRPRQNDFRRAQQVPAQTGESKAMSKGLRKLGFRFVGPTTCYAFMQATGMVNDHEVRCFRYSELGGSED